MPTLEVQDYEHFSYDDAPLNLDEAIKRAGELRKKDTENFYRIRPTNESGTSFVVKKVPASAVYAELAGRVAKVLARFRPRNRAR
jgi:hypothetical protein